MDEQGEGGDCHTVTHTEGSGSQGNTEFNTLPREVSPLPTSLPRGRKRNPERTSENFVCVCVCGGLLPDSTHTANQRLCPIIY